MRFSIIRPSQQCKLRNKNKHMKKHDIIERLSAMAELTKAAEIKEQIHALIADLGPAQVADTGKLKYFVTVNDRVVDPAMKYPKQMITCHEILVEAGKVGETLERAEILSLIGEKADLLNTRQTPERIYAFYQKRMEQEGWLTRAKERVMGE